MSTRAALLLSVRAEVAAHRPSSVHVVSYVADRTPLIWRLCEVLDVDNMHRCRAFDQRAPGDAGPLKSEHDSHLKGSWRSMM